MYNDTIHGTNSYSYNTFIMCLFVHIMLLFLDLNVLIQSCEDV